MTPFGTAFFIPGYWSFDPERDFEWPGLKAHHGSRGVVKWQGVEFERKRLKQQQKERDVLDARQVSAALGEHGEVRLSRFIEAAKLRDVVVPAYIRRLVKAAEKKSGRGP